MSWVLETKRELLAMHVAVSSLSPVNIQIWKQQGQISDKKSCQAALSTFRD